MSDIPAPSPTLIVKESTACNLAAGYQLLLYDSETMPEEERRPVGSAGKQGDGLIVNTNRRKMTSPDLPPRAGSSSGLATRCLVGAGGGWTRWPPRATNIPYQCIAYLRAWDKKGGLFLPGNRM